MHLPDGPSSRVIWLAGELGIPIDVHEVAPVASLSLSHSQTEAPSKDGGFVASLVDGDFTILESGAIVSYLLDKFDQSGIMHPPVGSPVRPLFHQMLFYTSSTADHLLMQSYKCMYVGAPSPQKQAWCEEILQENKQVWEQHAVPVLTAALRRDPKGYIISNTFNAADVMVGYTLYLANLLGWLNDALLKDYFNRISKRPAYKRTFTQ